MEKALENCKISLEHYRLIKHKFGQAQTLKLEIQIK